MKVDFEKAALAYAAMGFAVFPLAAGTKVPAIPKWKGGNGCHDATTDPDTIRAWAKDFPNANIGIACGEPSGFWVLDVDPRNGGDQSLRALAARGYVFPPCPRARTGNGGWHFLYRHDARVKNGKKRLGPGLDTRSTGGYIVGAPSWIAPSEDGPGGVYRWEVPVDQVVIPRAPVWMLTMLAPAPRPQYLEERSFAAMGNTAGLERFVQGAMKGSVNNSLYWAACRMGEAVRAGKMGISEARARLEAAARELAARDGLTSVRNTIESGLTMGGARNAR
jgi:hypothetical protein